MSKSVAAAFSEAMKSSLVVRVARHAGVGSMLVARLAAAREWSVRTHARILIGLGGPTTPEAGARQSERLMALTADSRLVSLLESWIAAASDAGRSSWTRRAFSGTSQLDVRGRVRLAGLALVVAVIAHVLFFLAVGMTVTWIGWTTRITLLSLGLTVFWTPGMWAAAWLDRRR